MIHCLEGDVRLGNVKFFFKWEILKHICTLRTEQIETKKSMMEKRGARKGEVHKQIRGWRPGHTSAGADL